MRSPDCAKRNPGTMVKLAFSSRVSRCLTRATNYFLPKRERSAERRIQPMSAHRADKWTQSAPLICCAAARAFGARSPSGAPHAALARANASAVGSAPVPAFPETWLDERYSLSPVTSLPSSSETGRHAGRAVAQSRPGAECKSARGHRPCSAFESALAKAPSHEQDERFVS